MFCRFCHILPTTAIYGQYVAIYGNVPSAAIRNVLPYSVRVGLYRVGGMWWERVVVCKVLRGGPVTHVFLPIKAPIPIGIFNNIIAI